VTVRPIARVGVGACAPAWPFARTRRDVLPRVARSPASLGVRPSY
jgi:hypothetical protein